MDMALPVQSAAYVDPVAARRWSSPPSTSSSSSSSSSSASAAAAAPVFSRNSSTLTHLMFKSLYVPPVCHYAVGVVKGNDLHLVPLSATYQLRPSFEHVDREDASKAPTADGKDAAASASGKANAGQGDNDDEDNNNNDGNASGDDDDDDDDNNNSNRRKDANKNKDKDGDKNKQNLQPLQYKKTESDRAASARKNSYAYKRSLEDSEEWVQLAIRARSEADTRRMLCSRQSHKLAFRPEEYLRSLQYLPAKRDDKSLQGVSADKSGAPATVTSVVKMIVRAYGASGAPLSFRVFSSSVPSLPPSLLLSSFAVTSWGVRGNFVLRSSLTEYPPAAQIVRDVALLLLVDCGYVERRRLALTVGSLCVKGAVVEHMLKQFAVKVDGRERWVMRVTDDKAFEDEIGDAAEQYARDIDRRREQLKLYVEYYKNIGVIENVF